MLNAGQRHGHEERDAGGGGAVSSVAAGPDQPDCSVQKGRIRSDSLAAEGRLILHQVSFAINVRLIDAWNGVDDHDQCQ